MHNPNDQASGKYIPLILNLALAIFARSLRLIHFSRVKKELRADRYFPQISKNCHVYTYRKLILTRYTNI